MSDCPICGELCEPDCPLYEPPRRSRRRSAEPTYEDAWGGAAEDRSTYNLGNGCRRVPARGSSD